MIEESRHRNRSARLRLGLLLAAALLIVGGCVAVADDPARLSVPPTAGFGHGLWHGLILPISVLVSLLAPDVSIYEVHNNGAWYDVGYVLGVALIFSGPARLGPRRRA